MRYYDILNSLEFIKGNIIADEPRIALQQLKELMDKLHEEAEKQTSPKA